MVKNATTSTTVSAAPTATLVSKLLTALVTSHADVPLVRFAKLSGEQKRQADSMLAFAEIAARSAAGPGRLTTPPYLSEALPHTGAETGRHSEP